MYRRQATIELATSEILPSEAAQAPQNSDRRSSWTHRNQRRWPDSPECQTVRQLRKTPLYSCLNVSVKLRATFHSTWTEDRATVGTDPSADPGAKTEGRRPAIPAVFLHLRDWHESDKSRGSGGWPPVLAICFFRFFKLMVRLPSNSCHRTP